MTSVAPLIGAAEKIGTAIALAVLWLSDRAEKIEAGPRLSNVL